MLAGHSSVMLVTGSNFSKTESREKRKGTSHVRFEPFVPALLCCTVCLPLLGGVVCWEAIGLSSGGVSEEPLAS